MGICFVAVLLGIISKTPEVTLKLKSPCICYGFANNIYVTIVIPKKIFIVVISAIFFSQIQPLKLNSWELFGSNNCRIDLLGFRRGPELKTTFYAIRMLASLYIDVTELSFIFHSIPSFGGSEVIPHWFMGHEAQEY